MLVTEVAPAGGPAEQFIELRDPVPEPFPLPEYSVAATGADGAVLGSQVLTPPFPFRDSTAPFVLGGSNVTARHVALGFAIPAGAARACFYTGDSPPSGLINCLEYGGLAIAPGQSAQRQSCGAVAVAAPTPNAPNVETGVCSGGGGGGGGDPPGPGADETAPQQKLAGKRRQDVDKLALTVTLSEAGSVTARASVNVPRAARVLRFRSVTRSVAADRPAKLRLLLGRKARRTVKNALARGARLTARVTVVARDVAGNRGPRLERRVRLSD
jgi:hypothetical protein